MRIIINGQQAFGKAVLEAMLERGDNVVAVFCAPDKEGRPVDPLKEFALSKDIPVHQPASYKDEATLALIRDLKPDLLVMAYVTIFVPEAARDIPTHGSICFHPSVLPLHRGPSSINWPVITSYSIHYTKLYDAHPDDRPTCRHGHALRWSVRSLRAVAADGNLGGIQHRRLHWP